MWPTRARRSNRERESHELVACPPQSDISTAVPRESVAVVAAAITAAVEANLQEQASVFPLEEDREWFALWPGEHYAFLDGLARVVQPDLVLDVGTYHGASALAMAPHAKKIVTYDVVSLHEIGNAYEDLTTDFPNVQQVIGDLQKQVFYKSHLELITKADLVLLDGPKDGVFEYSVVPRLISDMKKGSILILDDIRFANMVELWRSIDRPRVDVGCFAHSSGTGVVFI